MTKSFHKSQVYIEYLLKHIDQNSTHNRRGGKPFITISRESGAYGMTIAEMLVGYLREQDRRKSCHWMVFDKNLVQTIMEDHSLADKIAPYLSENTISEMKDILEELFGLHPSKWTLVHKMSETILSLAQVGYVILVGRASNIITRHLPKGFHIRLVGSFDLRVKHLQEYYSLSAKEAKNFGLKEERDRENFVKKYFHKDINDPLSYDLVINTDTISTKEAVRMVGDLVLGHVSVMGKTN